MASGLHTHSHAHAHTQTHTHVYTHAHTSHQKLLLIAQGRGKGHVSKRPVSPGSSALSEERHPGQPLSYVWEEMSTILLPLSLFPWDPPLLTEFLYFDAGSFSGLELGWLVRKPQVPHLLLPNTFCILLYPICPLSFQSSPCLSISLDVKSQVFC